VPILADQRVRTRSNVSRLELSAGLLPLRRLLFFSIFFKLKKRSESAIQWLQGTAPTFDALRMEPPSSNTIGPTVRKSEAVNRHSEYGKGT
jgi:hypothetical protein